MKAFYQSAFTLLELLVAITIISVLAALSFAAASQARQAASSSQCLGNLRQWGIALALYSSEHNSDIPRRGQGVQPVFQMNRPDDWFNCLPPYVGMTPLGDLVTQGKEPKIGEKSIFLCPNAKPTSAAHFLPYAMNMYLSPWNLSAMQKIVQIPEPTRLVFMADGPCGYASTVPSSQGYNVPARHRGSANLIFLDGHAASFRGDYLGCGAGAIERKDVHWKTGLEAPNQVTYP